MERKRDRLVDTSEKENIPPGSSARDTTWISCEDACCHSLVAPMNDSGKMMMYDPRWKHWIAILDKHCRDIDAMVSISGKPFTEGMKLAKHSLQNLSNRISALIETCEKARFDMKLAQDLPQALRTEWNNIWLRHSQNFLGIVPEETTNLVDCIDEFIKFISKGGNLQTELAYGTVGYVPHPARKERWINLVKSLREAGKAEDVRGSWGIIEKIVNPIEGNLAIREIPAKVLEQLGELYGIFANSATYLINESNNLRMQLIMPMFVYLEMPFVQVELGKMIEGGNFVNMVVQLTLIIRCSDQFIMFSEVKNNNFNDELAKVIIACEMAAETSGCDVVHGIVSNFETWKFVRSSNDGVTIDSYTMESDGSGFPTIESIRVVTGKIKAMLDNPSLWC